MLVEREVKLRRRDLEEQPLAVDVDDGGQRVAAVAGDRLFVWQTASNEPPLDIELPSSGRAWLTEVQFSPDGEQVLVGRDEQTHLITLKKPRPRLLEWPRGERDHLSTTRKFTPDSRRVVQVARLRNERTVQRAWAVGTARVDEGADLPQLRLGAEHCVDLAFIEHGTSCVQLSPRRVAWSSGEATTGDDLVAPLSVDRMGFVAVAPTRHTYELAHGVCVLRRDGARRLVPRPGKPAQDFDDDLADGFDEGEPTPWMEADVIWTNADRLEALWLRADSSLALQRLKTGAATEIRRGEWGLRQHWVTTDDERAVRRIAVSDDGKHVAWLDGKQVRCAHIERK